MKKKTVFSKTLKIALLSFALCTFMFGGQAKADVVMTFNGFPSPLPYTQLDKVYDGFVDLNGWFNAANNTTSIKTQTLGVPLHDVNTVTFAGIFSAGKVYKIQYTMDTTDPLLDTSAIGVGINQSFGTGTPATIQKIVKNAAGAVLWDSGLVTGNSVDKTFATPIDGKLFIEDTLTVFQSTVNGVSNSYTQTGTTSVPEPTTMMLLGFGLIGLTGIKRKLTRKLHM